jgi:hypothetical protein
LTIIRSFQIEQASEYRYPLEQLFESRGTVKRRHHKITRALIAGAVLLCLGLASFYLLTRVATHSMNQFTDRLVAKAAEQKQARLIEAERTKTAGDPFPAAVAGGAKAPTSRV